MHAAYAEDVVKYSCTGLNFTACLEVKKDVLTVLCGSYLRDMEKCYKDVQVMKEKGRPDSVP